MNLGLLVAGVLALLPPGVPPCPPGGSMLPPATADVLSSALPAAAARLPRGWSVEAVEVRDAAVTVRLRGPAGAAGPLVLGPPGAPGARERGRWFSLDAADAPALALGRALDQAFPSDPWTPCARTEPAPPPAAPVVAPGPARPPVHRPVASPFLARAVGLLVLVALLAAPVVAFAALGPRRRSR